jgi:hypothetical protein
MLGDRKQEGKERVNRTGVCYMFHDGSIMNPVKAVREEEGTRIRDGFAQSTLHLCISIHFHIAMKPL